MTFLRVRERNGLPRADVQSGRYRDFGLPDHPVNRVSLRGDLDRMEDDYLHPVYPERPDSPFAMRPPRSSPAEVAAVATGLPVGVVRLVLAYVFQGKTYQVTTPQERQRNLIMEALHSICTTPVDYTFGLECISAANHSQQADRVLAALFPAVADCGRCRTSMVIHAQHGCPEHDPPGGGWDD